MRGDYLLESLNKSTLGKRVLKASVSLGLYKNKIVLGYAPDMLQAKHSKEKGSLPFFQ